MINMNIRTHENQIKDKVNDDELFSQMCLQKLGSTASSNHFFVRHIITMVSLDYHCHKHGRLKNA